MRQVSELYGKHAGDDIYVVGSGASMRVFPPDFLKGRVTIGLNQAWKVAPVRYGITIGPHLNVPEFMPDEAPRPEITWITRRAKAAKVLTEEQFRHADKRFYTFDIRHGQATDSTDWVSDTGRELDYVRRPTGSNLYQWSSISQTAVNLAANMGARTVILVGCDNCSLADNHHGHQQHTKWLGKPPDERYEQYYEGLAEVRTALRQRGVDLLSLTPFVKLDDPTRDFLALCEELDRPPLLAGEDISEQDHPRRLQGRPVPPPTPPPFTRLVLRRARTAGRRAMARARARTR